MMMVVRIPSASTTAYLAPQGLAQNVPAGSSFSVILAAATERPLYVQSVVGFTAKGQRGQSLPNRGAAKQAEVQALPVASKAASRGRAVPSDNDRAGSDRDNTTEDHEDVSQTIKGSTPIAAESSWSATSNEVRPQSPAASAVLFPATSTPELSGPITWFGNTFETMIAGSSLPQVNDERLIQSAARTEIDKSVVSRKASGQVGDQPSALQLKGNACGTPAIPRPIQMNASEAEGAPVHENGLSAGEGTLSAKEKAASAKTDGLGPDVNESEALHPASDVTARERGTASQSLPTSATPQETSAPDDSASLVAPNGSVGIAGGSLESAIGPTLQQPIPLPIPTVFPAKDGGIELAASPAQRADSGRTRSKNPDFANAGNSDDASAHSFQGTQADGSQSFATTSRVADGASTHPQVQAVVDSLVPNEAPAALRSADTTVEASRPNSTRHAEAPADADSASAMATSAIGAASLMQTTARSEMRIGLNSNGFGDISINTSISDHQLVAKISLDHSELSQTISAHLQSAQAKLGDELGLRVSIELSNVGSPHMSDTGHSSQKERNSSAGLLSAETALAPGDETIGATQEIVGISSNEARLDIRA
ncbi:MAG: hypothetical protein ABR923_07360 [Terracidiphilus sp.]|jgi:hypothetical protein